MSRRRDVHAADTRAAVVAAAEEMFTDPGYADTSIDAIASRAGVTKGAVYHHFADKEELFRTVVERLFGRVGERLGDVEGRAEVDAWDAVCAAYQTRLDLVVADRAYQRIVDQDAAGVLGVQALETLAKASADAALIPVIEMAVRHGAIRPLPAERLARMMGALLSAACREIAVSPAPSETRSEVGQTLDALLQGLRIR